MKKILLIEICNYKDYPIGGYLSFAKQMLNAFGNQLALVGLVTDDETPIGIWTKKVINGVEYDFFGVRRAKKNSKKKIIPERLIVYFLVRKYRSRILSYDCKNIFVQTPEVLLALNIGDKKNICCRIPGLENPLVISRYSYSKYFSGIFEKNYFKALSKVERILATGDDKAIINYIKRVGNTFNCKKIKKFPTRINTDIFKPRNNEKMKIELGLDVSKNYIVTSGRLSQFKGWEFMLECFIDFKKVKPNSKFLFLGDGEDNKIILNYIKQAGISGDVQIMGRLNHDELGKHLNAADLYIMGSYVEGWSTALVEAISCAKPVICTNFSSSEELIDHGYNGFVIKDRKKDEFITAMLDGLNLPVENLIKKSVEMEMYSTSLLKNDILKYWNLV